MPLSSSENLTDIVRRGAPRPWRRRVLMLGLIILLGGGAYYYLKNGEEEAAAPDYTTAALKKGDLVLEITATGNLAPTNKMIIGSEISGTAEEVYVDTNDFVTKGQALAKLDTTKFAQQTERTRANLLASKARVNQAKATLAEQTAALARSERLFEISAGQSPSKAVMDTAKAAVQRATADLESAEAGVEGAKADVLSNERDLELTVIRAPTNGVVLTRSLEIGQTVAASFTAPELFTLAEDLKKMELLITVAEADVGRLKKGQQAMFKVDAWPTRTYDAVVKKVSFGSVLTNNVVTYSTELELKNDDLSLRPGMTATADIRIDERKNVWLVPNAALRFDPAAYDLLEQPEAKKATLVERLSPGRRRGSRWGSNPLPPQGKTGGDEPHVWSLENDKPVLIPVVPGISDGSMTEVSGERLAEGMLIITGENLPPQP